MPSFANATYPLHQQIPFAPNLTNLPLQFPSIQTIRYADQDTEEYVPKRMIKYNESGTVLDEQSFDEESFDDSVGSSDTLPIGVDLTRKVAKSKSESQNPPDSCVHKLSQQNKTYSEGGTEHDHY